MEYGKAILINPRCASAFINLAYTYQTEGKFRRAYEMFNHALAIEPNNMSALEGRAMVMMHVQHPLGALADVTKALSLDPDNFELLTNRGVIYQMISDPARAAEDYKVCWNNLSWQEFNFVVACY